MPQYEALVQAFADLVEKQLRESLDSPSVMREIQRAWKESSLARLPLAILGHEENPEQLWVVVAQLDRRFKGYPDPVEDEAQSQRRLESALDACSFQIVEKA